MGLNSFYIFLHFNSSLSLSLCVAVFNPTCGISYDSEGNVVCTCSGGGGTIQSITYTINGVIQRTGIKPGTKQWGLKSHALLYIKSRATKHTFSLGMLAYLFFNTQPNIINLPNASPVNALVRVTLSTQGSIQRPLVDILFSPTSQFAASSVSQFQIEENLLQFGQNTIVITFTSASGVVRTVTFQVTRVRGQLQMTVLEHSTYS